MRIDVDSERAQNSATDLSQQIPHSAAAFLMIH
jgi:hypothetical protein